VIKVEAVMRRRDFLLSAGFALAGSRPAWAQSGYPGGLIHLIVPRAAGGVVDIVARLWSEAARPLLGTIVVENQAGGAGIIGATTVARARPDGLTVLVGTTSELITSPIIVKSVPYDPVRDLVSVSMIAVSVSSIMVHQSIPVKTLQELVAYAKANPGKLSYGSPGVGTSAHLCAELFKKVAGLPDIVHVPYKGAAPGLVDFFDGQVPMFASSVSPQVLEMHRRGQIRILVAASPTRLKGAPELPISAEVGFPDLIALQFVGLFVPRGTPRYIVDELAKAGKVAIADPGVQDRMINSGFEPISDSGPEKAAAFVSEEINRWTPLINSIGLRAN
jgi:tripartite-type tricarboxylate transporter receptor subunit TctC